MLENGIAIILLLLGLIVGCVMGWWIQAKKVTRLEGELRTARESEAVARTNLENMEGRFEEEKKRMEEIRAAMENSFKAMAADIANTNSATFLKQAGEQFKSLKENSEKHLDKSLEGVNKTLESINTQAIELKSSLDTSHKTTKILSDNTAQLREVLSSSQKRGQWGERMVEDILQVIGLVEEINYTKQQQVSSGQRPDFTFILPQQKKLNMDVKFPLDHYQNYIEADSDEAQTQEKEAFLKDVRTHIKTVSGREYINPADGTLEYVMLFIPNEAIYGFINREDSKLVDEALQNRVLLCSPLTLYAMLSLVHQATQSFIMNERASEVMSLVNQFRTQWKKYVGQMDKMAGNIESLTKNYKDLVNTRTRALDRPLDKIENLSQIDNTDSTQLLE